MSSLQKVHMFISARFGVIWCRFLVFTQSFVLHRNVTSPQSIVPGFLPFRAFAHSLTLVTR